MTDREKLDKVRAEIESYKSAAEFMLKGENDFEHWDSQKGVCEKLLYFIDSMPEEPASEDLEQASLTFAKKDSKEIKNPANFHYVVADKSRIFKVGAQWQKKLMMEKAVEGYISLWLNGTRSAVVPVSDEYKVNDKIKIIIIKED